MKVPARPPPQLVRDDADITDHPELLWRIHRTAGQHVTAWNHPRTYGPLPTMRWDPHPEPAADHAQHGVLYASGDITTAVAEVFQDRRRIDIVTGEPVLLAWTPTRPLSLLDLTGSWPLRNGAAHALNQADHAICRAWAQRIYSQWNDLDGLKTTSTMTGESNIVLFNRAVSAVPHAPKTMRPLTHPAVTALLRRSAGDIGYRL